MSNTNDPILNHIVAGITPTTRIVAVAGPVAVGKSTFAKHLAHVITSNDDDTTVEVVSTDGFLYPNANLEALGLIDRKGFPESYDIGALRAFTEQVRANAPTVTIPVHSHDVFDIVSGRTITTPRLAIIEGVNALQPEVAALADLTMYLDAPLKAIVGWYCDRFVELTQRSRATGEGFYVRFASLSDAEVVDMAHEVWNSINGPNLDEFIRPSKANAHVVVQKDSNHRIIGVEQRKR